MFPKPTQSKPLLNHERNARLSFFNLELRFRCRLEISQLASGKKNNGSVYTENAINEKIMKKFLALVLLFAVSSDTSAEGNAKSASPYSKSAVIKIAKSAGPRSISSDATILDYDGIFCVRAPISGSVIQEEILNASTQLV